MLGRWRRHSCLRRRCCHSRGNEGGHHVATPGAPVLLHGLQLLRISDPASDDRLMLQVATHLRVQQQSSRRWWSWEASAPGWPTAAASRSSPSGSNQRLKNKNKKASDRKTRNERKERSEEREDDVAEASCRRRTRMPQPPPSKRASPRTSPKRTHVLPPPLQPLLQGRRARASHDDVYACVGAAGRSNRECTCTKRKHETLARSLLRRRC